MHSPVHTFCQARGHMGAEVRRVVGDDAQIMTGTPGDWSYLQPIGRGKRENHRAFG